MVVIVPTGTCYIKMLIKRDYIIMGIVILITIGLIAMTQAKEEIKLDKIKTFKEKVDTEKVCTKQMQDKYIPKDKQATFKMCEYTDETGKVWKVISKV